MQRFLVLIFILVLVYIFFNIDKKDKIDNFGKSYNINLNCGSNNCGSNCNNQYPDVIVPVYSPWRTYYPWSWVYPYNWNYPYYWSQYNFW